MDTLAIIQTIFYLVSSIAIIVVGVMLGILIYYLICIFRDTKNIADDLNQTYHKAKKRVGKIISKFNKNKHEKENRK